MYAKYLVSIPQAVSTVATKQLLLKSNDFINGFNTASGKYCCNRKEYAEQGVAIILSFNTASGKYCCNVTMAAVVVVVSLFAFQYRKR